MEDGRASYRYMCEDRRTVEQIRIKVSCRGLRVVVGMLAIGGKLRADASCHSYMGWVEAWVGTSLNTSPTRKREGIFVV